MSYKGLQGIIGPYQESVSKSSPDSPIHVTQGPKIHFRLPHTSALETPSGHTVFTQYQDGILDKPQALDF